MKPYESLAAWRRSHELTLAVYRLTDRWPGTERFGLTAQLRRAAVSIPTNIAEGSAKRGKAEYRRYLDIAIGSLSEVCYLLRLALDLEILSREEWLRIDAVRDQAARVTWLLYRSLRC